MSEENEVPTPLWDNEVQPFASPAQRPSQRSEFATLITTHEGNEYRISCTLVNGVVEDVVIADREDDTVLLPFEVLEQLHHAVQAHRSMVFSRQAQLNFAGPIG